MSSAPPLSHILLLGATGRTGRLVLADALSRGHLVTALVRSTPTTLPSCKNLTLIQGDPCSTSSITKALISISAPVVVISTLGQTRVSGNPFSATTSPPRFMASSAAAVVAAVKESDATVLKFIVMSMFGTASSFANLNFLMRWTFVHSNMLQTLQDQNLVDEEVKRSGLKYVLVRSAMLKGEDVAPIKVLGDHGEKAGFVPSVSAKSVAGFMLDMVVSDQWDFRTPVVSH